jgi:sugar O-acyltransferase (sialic acid O-acetyltransferase NeuD family)
MPELDRAPGHSFPVVLWGAAGHARVLRECLLRLGCPVIALFDRDDGTQSPFPDVPIYAGASGFARWRAEHPEDGIHFAVAIGGHRGGDRLAIHAQLQKAGLHPLTIIHPAAFVAETARCQGGSQVLAGAALGADAEIGHETILNTNATVDHECRLGDGVHVAPGATLTGCVQVGDRVLVGAGAVILPRLRIGPDAIVGAGAVVTRDVPAGVTVVGNPARALRRVA